MSETAGRDLAGERAYWIDKLDEMRTRAVVAEAALAAEKIVSSVMQERAETAEATVWAEVAAERHRAHQLHGANSMEELPELDMCRLSILVEEVGEVAKEFNEARHKGKFDVPALRAELIQVAAMAGAWADRLGQ